MKADACKALLCSLCACRQKRGMDCTAAFVQSMSHLSFVSGAINRVDLQEQHGVVRREHFVSLIRMTELSERSCLLIGCLPDL